MPIYKNTPRSRARVDKIKSDNITRITIGEEDIGSEAGGVTRYICNRCDGPLDKISDDEYHCNQCRITTIPSIEDVRTDQDLTVPRGPVDETLVSCPDLTKDVSVKKQPVYRGSFKELSKRVHFTSYEVKDGSGRPIQEEDE
jgi:hypothetical protein